MNIKIEPTKIIGIVAAVAGVAATLLGNVSQQKSIEKAAEEAVKKAMETKN